MISSRNKIQNKKSLMENYEEEQNCELQEKDPFNLNSCSTKNWRSETKESFPRPENVAQEQIGKRKMLLKKYFELQAAEEILNAEIGDSEIVDPGNTEYIEKFCDPDFKPFTENCDYDINKQIKYPLYGGLTHSLYEEQMNRGQLKIRSSVSNFNHPFRKTSSFTTPPELTLREIDY